MWNPVRMGLSVGTSQITLAAATRRGERLDVQKTATEILPAGLCHPSPVDKNITDVGQWKTHVSTLLGRLPRARRMTLSLPDAAMRVLFLTLQQVPDNKKDLERLIQWHMEKNFLHPLGEARVSHQVLSRTPQQTRLLATAIKNDVVAQYEEMNGAGGSDAVEIDRVGPSSLHVFNLFRPLIARAGAQNFIFARLFDRMLTVMIFASGLPNFIRVKEFPESDQWDEAFLAEMTTSLAFYEGGGNALSSLTHLFWAAGEAFDFTEQIRASLRLVLTRLDPRGVIRSASISDEIVAAAAAAGDGL